MQEAYIRIYIPGIYQAARAFCLSVTSVAHQASPVSEQGPRDSTAAAYVFRNEPTRVFDVYGLCGHIGHLLRFKVIAVLMMMQGSVF